MKNEQKKWKILGFKPYFVLARILRKGGNTTN